MALRRKVKYGLAKYPGLQYNEIKCYIKTKTSIQVAHVSMMCMAPDAKKLKLRQTWGMSIALSNHTGLPWSCDSASANSSSRDSTMSAILLGIFPRSLPGSLDHLQIHIHTHTHTHTHTQNHTVRREIFAVNKFLQFSRLWANHEI